MTNTKKNKIASYTASIGGILVAVANAWITIDWNNFEFTNGNIMKLGISAIIAIGGISSKISIKNKPEVEQ